MSAPEIWTIERILKVTQEYFASKRIESARLDAELLLVHVIKVPRITLYTNFDRPLQQAEVDAYRALVKRRGNHEPVAYIMGVREFYGRSYEVTRDVLVPRPETEHLVDAVLEWVRKNGIDSPRIIDVGTGSGAIAVTLASELPEASVTAVDISEAALAVARGNAAALSASVEFITSDLLAGVASQQQYDVIVANLPYIGENERASLPAAVRDHEPAVALFSGADGLDAIRRLAREAIPSLATSGLLALEIGCGQSAILRNGLPKLGWKGVTVRADLAGHARVLMATNDDDGVLRLHRALPKDNAHVITAEAEAAAAAFEATVVMDVEKVL
ncbi:MAG: peptide chain release factor N(5)-glutamine methyltransferase [Clostridia bacterium]|nr:peptide chain release factor N(5)-glutamine methyltransferase [Deltaproteobacteria bacterium]